MKKQAFASQDINTNAATKYRPRMKDLRRTVFAVQQSYGGQAVQRRWLHCNHWRDTRLAALGIAGILSSPSVRYRLPNPRF